MYDVEIENRFWSKVERDDANPDKCWECVAMCLNRDGYGQFWANGKLIRAHRFSYQLFHNRLITDEMFICHKCDNPSCVNPHHLSEGTTQENTADREKKGRSCKGEKQPASKLTVKQVKEIREKYDKKNGINYSKLGRIYGVSKETIRDIILRNVWKDI